MKEELLLLRKQLKMGHRISFAEAMLLQRAIDILVNKAGNSPAQSDCRPAQNYVSPEQNGDTPAQSQGWIPVSERMPDCWCRTCRPVAINDMRFVVCPDCGNKRCPRANDHRNACTGSNEPGQEGSAYPAAPQEVKSE